MNVRDSRILFAMSFGIYHLTTKFKPANYFANTGTKVECNYKNLASQKFPAIQYKHVHCTHSSIIMHNIFIMQMIDYQCFLLWFIFFLLSFQRMTCVFLQQLFNGYWQSATCILDQCTGYRAAVCVCNMTLVMFTGFHPLCISLLYM